MTEAEKQVLNKTMTLTEVQKAISEKNICVLVPTYNNEKRWGELSAVFYNTRVTLSLLMTVLQIPHHLFYRIIPKSGLFICLKIKEKEMLWKQVSEWRKNRIQLCDYYWFWRTTLPGWHSGFVEALLKESQDVLLIGNRNMAQDGIPKKVASEIVFLISGSGLKQGLSWKIHNRGSGCIRCIKFPENIFTPKFEFEIEIIVRTAWRHVPVKMFL